MNTSRFEAKQSIDLKTCSFAEFKEQARLESTLNLLRHAIQSTVDTTEKTDYVLNEEMHKSKINSPLYYRYHKYYVSKEKQATTEQRIAAITHKYPELFESLNLKFPLKIVTALKQYQAENTGKNTWLVNLLIAEYYLKFESIKEFHVNDAIARLSALFNENYYDFRDQNAEVITKIILEIYKSNKDKAKELLKAQFMQEVSNPKTLYIDVKHIVQALKAMDAYDEQLEKELLSLLSREISCNFLDNYDNDHMSIVLLCLSYRVKESNRTQLLDLLFNQFRLELTIANREEISYQLLFEELVKADYFNKVSSDKMDDLLGWIQDKHLTFTKHYSKNLIAKLEEIKKFVTEPGRLYSVERALAKCYLDLVPDHPEKTASKIVEISLEQLKILFLVELESKLPRLNVIVSMINVFLSKKCFDEKQKNALIKYYQNHSLKNYTNLNLTDRKILMNSLIDLAVIERDSKIEGDSNSSTLDLLGYLVTLYEYELDMSEEVSEIAQIIFDTMLKWHEKFTHFFAHIDTKDFPGFLKAIAQHFTEKRIAHLNQIKDRLGGEPEYLSLVDQALLHCYRNRIKSAIDPAKEAINTPPEQLKIIFLEELESAHPRFNVIQSMMNVLLIKKDFDEKQQNAVIKYFQRVILSDYKVLSYSDQSNLMKALIDHIQVATPSNRIELLALLGKLYTNEFARFVSISKKCFDELIRLRGFNEMPFENFKDILLIIARCVSQLNQIKEIITDSRRIDLINQTLLNCYAALPGMDNAEKAIEIANEIKLDVPDILKKLSKRVEGHKAGVAVELLLKCHKHGDLDALLDVASIYEREEKLSEEKISKIIEYYKSSITESIKVSNWPILKRGASQLFSFLATLGGGFDAPQLTAIKETILLAYKSVYEDRIKIDSGKSDFFNLLSQYLMKTKPLNIDLGELFTVLHKNYKFDTKFQDLACSYFPEASEKRKEYLDLKMAAISNRWKLQTMKVLSESKSFTMTSLLQLVPDKLFFIDKTNPLFDEAKQIVELGVVTAISNDYIDSDVFKILFSDKIREQGDYAEIILNKFIKTMEVNKNHCLLFEMYYHMYQSDNFKDKNQIVNNIIKLIAQGKYLRKFKNEFFQLSLDHSLNEEVRLGLRNCGDAFYPATNTDEKQAREFVRISHIPAIAFLIKQKRFETLGNNPGYDYLCVLLLILIKGHDIPELKKVVAKANSRIHSLVGHVRLKYLELIQKAPMNLVNVHAYLRLNIKKTELVHDVFLQGMNQALGFKDDIEWGLWLNYIDTVNGVSKLVIKVTPSAPEESKKEKLVNEPLTTDGAYDSAAAAPEESKKEKLADEPLTTEGVSDPIKVPTPTPSAPPMEDENEPGRIAATPSTLFYHNPDEPGNPMEELSHASVIVPTM